MSADGSITIWLQDLKSGSEQAAQQIFDRYQQRVERLAAAVLGNTPRRATDEDDVVSQAFHHFFAGVRTFDKLDDRSDLWKILGCITRRRAIDQINAEARRGRRVLGESVFKPTAADTSSRGGIEQFADSNPTPQQMAGQTEELDRLLSELDRHGQPLRKVAVLRLKRLSNSEIAEQTGCSLRSIERRLRHIRAIWDGEIALDSDHSQSRQTDST